MEMIMKIMFIVMTYLSYIKKTIWISLFGIIIFSCISEKKNPIEKQALSMLNQKISFDNFDYKDSSKLSSNLIIYYLDSTQCTPCALENILLWRKFKKELKENDLNIIVISNDVRIYPLAKDMGIEYSILLDTANVFKTKYIKSEDLKLYTFVIDTNKKVIWIGNPLYDSQSWNMFNKFISKEQ